MRGGASSATIHPNTRKLVQNLKEVATGHGDDEILAMLKECNMDPDETVQRLMSQDTFHEVKRRNRKKETSSTSKESSEGRSRGTGAYRGGRGGGRGVARYVSSETNGRGRTGAPRENGNHASNLAPAAETKPPPPPPQVQLGPQSGFRSRSVLSSAGGSPGLPNGSLHYSAPAQVSWSKIAGHATMAEMLKSQQMPKALQPQRQPAAQIPSQQQFTSSGMYSSSDPVHHPFTSSNVIKREIGIVGIQRSFGDRGGLPSPPSQASSSQDDLRPVSPPPEPSTKGQDSSSSETLRAPVGNGRPAYQPPVTGNKTSGINLEWKPKLVAQEEAGVESVEALKFPEAEVLSVSSKFQGLSAREAEQQQVIMPNNFQSQGDLGLSFGSFGESFGSSIPAGFRADEAIDVPGSPEPPVPAKDILHDDEPASGGDIVPQDDPVHHQEEMPAPRDNLAGSAASSIPSASFTSPAEISKLRAQQQQQYSYLQSSQSYSSGIGVVSQIPSSHFDSQESHLQDLPSAPATLKQQHYADSGASYYSPAFRPSSEDARYQYLPTNTAAAKYGNGAVVMASQQHLPAHEVSTSSSLSSGSSTSQSSNTHSLPTAPQQQAVPAVHHAYPAQPTGVPVGHFGNVFGYHQYPSYTFVSPYHHQHGYTTNYPQPPVSSYSPSANYSPVAAAAAAAGAVKYTTLPQYKPGSAAAGNAPISSVTAAAYGGGGYGTAASSMYGGNPSGTAGSTPGYEDSPQYKESNLYMHGPQGDGARLWNDVTGQTSSFYTLSGQSQHSSYAQQPGGHTHPMASYTSLYHHPSQQQQQPGGPAAATGHQMIQQPQALSGAAGSTQVGGAAAAAAAAATYHQQLQRMQQQPSWNTY